MKTAIASFLLGCLMIAGCASTSGPANNPYQQQQAPYSLESHHSTAMSSASKMMSPITGY